MGDSIARLLCLSLLELLATPDNPAPPVVRHGDMQWSARNGMEVSFLWRPYLANITTQLEQWRATGDAGDMIVMGAGLWHVLHVTDAAAYEGDLRALAHTWRALHDSLV